MSFNESTDAPGLDERLNDLNEAQDRGLTLLVRDRHVAVVDSHAVAARAARSRQDILASAEITQDRNEVVRCQSSLETGSGRLTERALDGDAQTPGQLRRAERVKDCVRQWSARWMQRTSSDHCSEYASTLLVGQAHRLRHDETADEACWVAQAD